MRTTTTQKTHGSVYRLLVVAITLALVAGACGGSDTQSPTGDAALGVDPTTDAASRSVAAEPTDQTEEPSTETSNESSDEPQAEDPGQAAAVEADHEDDTDDEDVEVPDVTAAGATSDLVELSDVLRLETGNQVLQAGTYRGEALTNRGVLTIDQPFGIEWYSGAMLILSDPTWDPEPRRFLIFTAPLGVISADQAGIHQTHDSVVPEAAIAVPADLGAWLESIEQLDVTATGEVELAGSSARWYDFALGGDGQTFDCPQSPTCVGLLAMPDGVVTFYEGQTYRLYEIDALPGLVAWAVSFSEVDAAALAEYDQLMTIVSTAG